MIIKEYYETRKDGVNLYRRFDAVVAENGEVVKDENGNYIPTGLCIRKVGTDEVYAEAIDVEHAPFTYIETDIPIETEETEEIAN